MYCLSNHQFEELRTHYAAAQSHLTAIHSILIQVKQQENTNSFDASDAYPKRPMTKKEIAGMLGVSSRYFASQIKLLRPKLKEMGISERARLLPPKAVFYICSSLDIEKNDELNCNKLHRPS